MKNSIFLFCLLFLCGTSIQAQQHLIGVHLNGGFATGTLQNDTNGLFVPAIGAQGLFKLSTTPIYLGGEFGYGRYGTNMTRSNTVINGTEQRFRIRRNNNVATLTGLMRIMPETSLGIRPFVEAQLGGIHTYTRSRVRENRLSDPLSSGTEVYDWALLYQLGGGVMIPLNESKETFLELRVSYVNSGEMNLLTKQDASYNDQGQVTLTTRRVPFEMIQPSLAIKFNF
ncbi:hypothetical protein ACFOUP_17105 [Belliella kenyensis]|uniref:Outer membrane protein beta-barrel domain-containing protein n=1 Tax=Belliella kenyensis TaxID=1472724 RepID=A0ABV8EP88_9BACT|nr:hypothetical protein [Belliella kenyensis]MCH7402831.1 hypothetical protein [Belliella kenyensis]MDN3602537.1 hypothetical protein [Belliella kenyensis]